MTYSLLCNDIKYYTLCYRLHWWATVSWSDRISSWIQNTFVLSHSYNKAIFEKPSVIPFDYTHYFSCNYIRCSPTLRADFVSLILKPPSSSKHSWTPKGFTWFYRMTGSWIHALRSYSSYMFIICNVFILIVCRSVLYDALWAVCHFYYFCLLLLLWFC